NTELEQEQETRLAQRLAAEQLRHQCQILEALWGATTDPKYFRQQMRAILALSRLGIVPGTIEALAADAVAGPFDPNEPQPPWSEDDPWANSAKFPGPKAKAESEAASSPPAPPASTCDVQTSTGDAMPSSPPAGDCSAFRGPNTQCETAASDAAAP